MVTRKGRTTTVIGVRVPHELADRVKAEAERRGMTSSELVAKILNKVIK